MSFIGTFLTEHSSIGSSKKTKELPKELYRFYIVHPEDQLPVNIIMPDLKDGPWIAGGACLKWYQNKPVGEHSDIDVFCKNEKQANKLINYIKNELALTNHGNGYASLVFETKNASTFSIRANNRDWKVQIITCKYYNSIQEVIDSFDISVCQVGTAGSQWVLGKDTAKDINERSLRFNRITKQTPKRLIKYWTYGYNPVPGTIETIQQHESCSWDFTGSDDYDNTL